MKKLIIIIIISLLTLTIEYIILKENDKYEIINDNSSNNIVFNEIVNGEKNLDDFEIDKVYKSKDYGDIHYSVYIPNDYDKSKSYPLYITLPGYEGLYFQGVGVDLKIEEFATEALKINNEMIILAPQLNDWGELSCNQTIALLEYYKKNYNISKIYANGYSGGGETMSLVLGKRADLIDAYLQVSSKWDGNYESTVINRTPVYIVIGESDEYYGSKQAINTYNTLYSMYEKEGLSKNEIDKILILDTKEKSYFTNRGINNEHAGGGLIAFDKDIMTWLLTR